MFRTSEEVVLHILQSSYLASPWTPKHSKMVQPDLDYMAADVQLRATKYTTPDCDMYSLGLLICTIYNNGKSLIQAGHNITSYTKQVEQVTYCSLLLYFVMH